MDIVVKGRHISVPGRFRSHASDKLTKLQKLDHKAIRVDVELTVEPNPRRADQAERVELTLHSKGPVIRAEAAAADRYAALDMALDKLLARLRKAADRRRVHHGNRTPMSVAAATAPLNGGAVTETKPEPNPGNNPDDVMTTDYVDDSEHTWRNGPMIVREKTHQAEPITLDQALYEMELVGHDFYLFVDAETKMPSAVYRRRGFDYGVIHLDV